MGDPRLAPGATSVGTALDTAADSTGERPACAPRAVEARRRGRFLLLVVAISLILVAWVFATPLMASPDEPSQVTQAAAVVRGQFDVRHQHSPIGPISSVLVPTWVQHAFPLPNCYAFKPQHPAACHVVVGRSLRPVAVQTQFSNYPPLFFVWTGLPTLVASGTTALYAMRLAAALVNAALLALGIELLLRYHRRRLPVIGALVALTPMVYFLASVVNAS